MARLDGKKIAILATDGFEQSELTSPKKALEHEGAVVDVVAPHEGTIRGWKEKNWGESVEVTALLDQVNAESYDALMLPGGVMNSDHLRTNPAAVAFVGAFLEGNKPIAAICHGPWTLIETGKLEGRRMTSYPAIKTDLINAGVKWVDEAAAVDRNLLTSRSPDDLPVFNEKMIEVFAAGPAPQRTQRKKAVSRSARAKAKTGAHGRPRGQKQAPRRRSAKRH